MEIQVIQLLDLLDEFGEDIVKEKILVDFSCPKNKDVQDFITHKAILWEKMDKSRTYLVLGILEDRLLLLAFFTLASVPISFDESVSNKRRKNILGTGFEANSKLSAILIGQLSKNFKNQYHLLLTGADLFDLAIHKALQANRMLGGRIIYLECEDKPKLREFYKEMKFDLYTDDNGNPIYNGTGLLIYMKSVKNIVKVKKEIKDWNDKIKVSG